MSKDFVDSSDKSLLDEFNKHYDDYFQQRFGSADVVPESAVEEFEADVTADHVVEDEAVLVESEVAAEGESELVAEPEVLEPVAEVEPVFVAPEVEADVAAEVDDSVIVEPDDVDGSVVSEGSDFWVDEDVSDSSDDAFDVVDAEPTVIVDTDDIVDEDLYPANDDLDESLDGTEVEPVFVVEDEDEVVYSDVDDSVVIEDEVDVVEPEVAAPAVVEREIVREVIVVDREQARDLGYAAEVEEPKSRPEPFGGAVDVGSVNVSPVPRAAEEDFRARAAASVLPSAQPEEKRSGLFGGLFGGRKARQQDSESAAETPQLRGSYSRVRDEGLDPETGRLADSDSSQFAVSAGGTLSLKTQDGYDAREERLRLQHVATEKRDVDPTVWLEETMLDALKLDASDLHITVDGETKDLRARIRVDGQMRDFDYVQGVPARVIMGRLKAATELSSGGSFEPEETIYTLELNGEKRKARAVLFRVEDGGEALVMRLPLTGNLRLLDELSFADYNLKLVKDLLAMPYKLIMIAGPMGSGKTTTAHGALLHVAKPTRTVWTIEDPVERRLPNMVQLEIDEDNGAGFDVLLSKLLRADYNTLFLGEIRDGATASAAVRQAKAGRQVMSTIHADDNIKALMRLIELAGDSPLSVLSAVGGVISQRLVRKLNPDWDGVDPDTKYKGRVPIHEILFISDELIEVMMQDRPLSEIKQATSEAVGSTFAMDAHRLIEAGVTDREEFLVVIGEYE